MRTPIARKGLTALLLALLAGCAAPKLSPQLAAEMGYQVLGPQMQYDDRLLMAWIPGPAVADSPLAADLARAMAPAARQPVHITVAGDDSAFAAQIIRAACALVGTELPQLRLVFVGNPAHAAEARQAVLVRRGSFYFEPAP